MWLRNGRYFGNVTVTDDLGKKTSRMVPMNGAALDGARDDYRRLLVEREDDRLRPLGLTPTVRDYVSVYTQQLAVSAKRASTVQKETAYLDHWKEKIGHVRLNKVRPHHLNKVLTDLAGQDYSARSVNLFLIAIRGLLKAALRDGHIKLPLPFEGLGWQRVDQKTRTLYSPDEIDQICIAAIAASKNGLQFNDYIRFLHYSGARRSEALRVRWKDVDFERGHVTIGAEGDAKNREARYVDLNPKLETHLKDMHSRRQPDSQRLFPSPQTG